MSTTDSTPALDVADFTTEDVDGDWSTCACGSTGWRCAECGDGIWAFPAESEPPTRRRVYDVISAVLDTETLDADVELVIDALAEAGLITIGSDRD